MLLNYIKIAVRNLLNNKIYSSINLIGLATGIACAILIIFFIKDELSYDKYHKNTDRIYRLSTEMKVGGNTFKMAASSFPMGPAAVDEFPEIETSARIIHLDNPLLRHGDNYFYEDKFYWADSTVFEIFSYNMLAGDPGSALAKPNSIVLTEEMSNKYFGDEEALGKIISYENNVDFVVTGIIKNLPKNSTLKFDFLASYSSLPFIAGQEFLDEWHAFYHIYTFVLLKKGSDPSVIEAKFPQFIDKYMGTEILKVLGREYNLSLMPLSEIYLYSDRSSEMGKTGNIVYIYIFGITAVFIILLACINFMNLMIARSARRIKEIGLRKVFGAYRQQIIYQFLGESIIISSLALPLSYLLVEFSIPIFNSIADKNMSLNFSGDYLIFLISIAIVAGVGLLSGSYPSFFLSGFNPSRAVRGEIKIGNSKNLLRQSMIIFQFTVSVVLLIGTITVYNQLHFLQNKKIGINKEQIISLQASDEGIDTKFEYFSDQLLKQPGIEKVASSTYMPGSGIIATPFRLEGANKEQKWEITTLPVNHAFIETVGIEIIAGRDYSDLIASDTVSSFIINEKAVASLGFENAKNAIGKRIIWLGTGEDNVGTIIGVVKNFNYGSLENQIAPLVMVPQNLWPGGLNYIAVRTDPRKMETVLPFIEESWEQTFPSIPFRYSFMDDTFRNLYQSELQLGRIFTAFAGLALFIACLGLLGLVTYMAEVKTKEIGIRKILGSSVSGIVTLISKEFFRLVLISNIIAWPLSYYIMENWLANFAYRIEVQYSVFLLSCLLTLILTLITSAIQSLNAALSDPIKSIKHE